MFHRPGTMNYSQVVCLYIRLRLAPFPPFSTVLHVLTKLLLNKWKMDLKGAKHETKLDSPDIWMAENLHSACENFNKEEERNREYVYVRHEATTWHAINFPQPIECLDDFAATHPNHKFDSWTVTTYSIFKFITETLCLFIFKIDYAPLCIKF